MTKVKRSDRQSYQKPQLTEVELKVEEAVLASCKTPTSGGPQATGCAGVDGQGRPKGKCAQHQS